MKKLFVFVLAAMFVLTLSVSAAETDSGIEWYEIELSPENFGTRVVSSTTDDLTINDDGSVTVDGILLFGFQLPREIPNGETVVVKISGSAEDNFRVWLLGNNEKTCSNIYTMSDGGYVSGRFDRAIELTAQDLDNVGNTEANDIIFKAKTTSDLLMNFTIESVTIYFCTMDEYVAGAIDFSEVVAFASEAESKLNALYDKLDDAEALEAGIAEIEEDYMPVLEGYLSLGNDDVVEAYNKLSDTIDDLRDEAILHSLADEIAKADAAIERANANAGDANVLNECLETVKEASNALSSRALTYKKSKEKSHELKDAIADIEAKIEALASGADTSDVGTADNAADTSAADNGNGSETSGGCGSVMGTTAIIVAFTAVFGCAIVKKD